MGKRVSLLAALVSLAFASSALAQSPHGEAQLSGAERLRVKGCGRTGNAVTLDFEIQPLACAASILPCPENGAWTLAGTPAPLSGLSSGGRRGARLRLDENNLTALESALEGEASALCGEPIDLRGLRAGGALKISKRGERARITLVATGLAASASADASRASYRVRARGAWQNALSQ
jgi:hypothetical protein